MPGSTSDPAVEVTDDGVVAAPAFEVVLADGYTGKAAGSGKSCRIVGIGEVAADDTLDAAQVSLPTPAPLAVPAARLIVSIRSHPCRCAVET